MAEDSSDALIARSTLLRCAISARTVRAESLCLEICETLGEMEDRLAGLRAAPGPAAAPRQSNPRHANFIGVKKQHRSHGPYSMPPTPAHESRALPAASEARGRTGRKAKDTEAKQAFRDGGRHW